MVTQSTHHRRFIEIAAASAAVRVDADGGILYGAKLLGLKSKNGREYTEQAARDAVPLYEGRKVYLNHPKRSEREDDRPFESWVGVVRNPRFESDGIYGDIHLLKENANYAKIIEAARNFPAAFGCSHVADGDSDFRNGVESVYRINICRLRGPCDGSGHDERYLRSRRWPRHAKPSPRPGG